jgi:hypothetical protein
MTLLKQSEAHKGETETMCTGTHPFIPAPGTALLTYSFDFDGVEAMITTHWLKATQWQTAELADLAHSAADAWGDNISGLVTSNLILNKVNAVDVFAENGYYAEYTPGSQIRGTLTDAMEGNKVAFKLKFSSGLRGRSFMGGIYHMGITKAQTVGRRIIVTQADAIRAAWAACFDDIAANSAGVLAITSYCYHRAWRNVALSTIVETISYTDLLLDVQSRRGK